MSFNMTPFIVSFHFKLTFYLIHDVIKFESLHWLVPCSYGHVWIIYVIFPTNIDIADFVIRHVKFKLGRPPFKETCWVVISLQMTR